MASNIITMVFGGDTSALERAARRASGTLDETESSFDKWRGRATVGATAVLGAFGAIAMSVGQAASVQQQALGGIESVFQENAGQIEAWANTAADSVGLSKTAFLELAGPIGASLKAAGMSIDEASDKTNQLITKGADLAATFGGSTSDAVGALGAALRGEFDSLERYGIALSASAIDAELAARGQDNLTGAALEAAKKQATLDLIMQQSSDSMGQFASESDTAAGAAERQAAKWENLQAELGQNLLPVMTSVGEMLQGLTQFASDNVGVVTTLALVIGGLAAGVFLVNAAITGYHAVMAIATAAQWLWNAAMSANPIGLVVLAIAALVAGLIWAYSNVEWFRNGVNAAFEGVKNAIGSAAAWVTNAWNGAMNFFASLPGRIGGFFSGIGNGIKSAFRSAFNFVASAWNNTVGRLSFRIPGWVPGLGGASFGVPRIPTFHTGGVVPGVAGSETLAMLQAGERVIPADRSGNSTATEVRFVGNTSDALATVIMQMIRTGKIQIA